MTLPLTDDQRYDALKDKKAAQGLPFILGVKTTMIFCRPGCPARLPLRENCLFYDDPALALQDGLRPCRRCYPLGGQHADLDTLMHAVYADPEADWSEKSLQAKGYAPTTLRRQFKDHTGFGLSDYIRWVRLGQASKTLQAGGRVIEAQLDAGFDSASGFRAAYGALFGTSPAKSQTELLSPLFLSWHETVMGRMVIIADEVSLYLLEFTNRIKMLSQVKRLHRLHKRPIIIGETSITQQTKAELDQYFKGNLRKFETPLTLTGTAFQKLTWSALCDIPYGQTCSYADLAVSVGNEKAVRAVAGSNAKNGLAIIVPCHRVIAKDGGLGGYAGGVSRKRALLKLEGVEIS